MPACDPYKYGCRLPAGDTGRFKKGKQVAFFDREEK